MTASAIERINPPNLPTPPGCSQLVVSAGGSTLYIAGQVALDREGMLVGPGDFAAQATQTFMNLVAALEAGGATTRHLVKMNTYVTDLSGLPDFRRVRDQFLDPALQVAVAAAGPRHKCAPLSVRFNFDGVRQNRLEDFDGV